jgi:hypothetical protein
MFTFCSRILLAAGANPSSEDKRFYTPLFMASRVGSIANIIDLLEIGHADPNHVAKDGNGKTPIFKARTYKAVQLLLSYGADPTITIKEKESNNKEDTGTSAFSHLLKYNAESVQAILDGFVSLTHQEHDNGKQLLVYDFGLFKHCTPKMNEMDLHYNAYKQDKSHLLTHPLMQIFLHLKWKQTEFFYWLNFIVYMLFVFVLTWQAFTFVQLAKCMDVEDTEGLCFKGAGDLVVCPSNMTSLNMSVKYNTNLTCHKNMWRTSEESPFSIGPILEAIGPDKVIIKSWTASEVCGTLFGVALIIREVLQGYASGFSNYIWSFENQLELFIIGLAIGFHVNSKNNIELAAHLGGWSLFFAWIDLTLILGRLPFFGKNIYMSMDVTKTMIWCLIAYLPSLIAFASAFHMFLSPSLLFDNPITSFLKVLVMMVGELEFSEYFIYNKVDEMGGRNISVQVI